MKHKTKAKSKSKQRHTTNIAATAKQEPKEDKKKERSNQLIIGELCLTSSDILMPELMNMSLFLLDNQIIKDYLKNLDERKLKGLGKQISNYLG